MYRNRNIHHKLRYITCFFSIIIILLPITTYSAELPVLGTQPLETSVEQDCLSIIVADNLTGSILKLKESGNKVNLIGGTVRLMAALVALDYMQPDDTVVVENEPTNLPQGARLIGFHSGMSVSVSDLIAAMLVYCANDAAVVLGEAVEAATNTNNFVLLMNDKAKKLGMFDTTYINATGLAVEGQTSTLADQLIFARTVFANITINSIMSQSEYQSQTDDPYFLSTMSQFSTIMLPNDVSYDSRVKAVARGSDRTETNMLIRAQNNGSDIVIFMVYPSRNIEEVYRAASELINSYIDSPAIDFSQYISDEVAKLSTGSNIVGLPWMLQPNQPLAFSAYKGFEPDFTQLKIEPDAASIMNLEDGTATMTAEVFYEDTFLTAINLTAPVVAAAPVSPDSEQTTDENNSPIPIYESADVSIQLSFMDRYGWIIYAITAAFMAVLLIFIGNELKKHVK